MNFGELARQNFLQALKSAGEAEKSFRQKAWDAFEQQGLPERGNEAWKYTSLKSLAGANWQAPSEDQSYAAISRSLQARFGSDFDIVLNVNGRPESKPSSGGYAMAPRSFDSVGSPLNFDDGFLSASAASNNGGFELVVKDGVQVARPLLIVHVITGEGAWTSGLNRIVLGKGSALKLAEIFVSPAAVYLRTDITRAEIGEDAALHWVRAQQEAEASSFFAEVQAHVHARANLSVTQLNCGATWSRSSVKAEIRGQGAEVSVNGLSFGRLSQHVDQRVQISHHVGQTKSSQLFKGILRDNSRGILNGKIYIAHGADKVDSSQLNHNLLLSPGAEADTKPELEVYADDVKANHGASVGRLDEDKLFYLLSRGIAHTEAEQMLAHAFTADVLMKIGDAKLKRFATECAQQLMTGGRP